MAKVASMPIAKIVKTVEAHEQGSQPRLFVTGRDGRIGVLAITDDGLVPMVDCIPDEDDVTTLAQKIKPARIGRWDASKTHRWTYAWTVGNEDWQLWSRRGGKEFWLADGKIHRKGPRPPLHADGIAAIQTFASPGWYEQGAEIRLEDETTIELAEGTNWAARLDPSYDYLQLQSDLIWAESLCKDLATVLGVPVGERIPERADA